MVRYHLKYVCVCVCIISIIAGVSPRIVFHHLLNIILNSCISTIKLSNATFINQTLITKNKEEEEEEEKEGEEEKEK